MKSIKIIGLVIVAFNVTSCNDFLNPKPNKSTIDATRVFTSNVTATAAVAGIYNNISNSSQLTGSTPSMSVLASYAANELINYGQDANQKVFEEHAILAQNPSVALLWSFLYNQIYQANAALEGIHASKSLSSDVANQLEGEVLFIRAFHYFYLVNLFGDVPIILTTDYNENRLSHRALIEDVYATIEDDLLKAQSLLTEKYISENKARPNKFTATALLARVYLYRENYVKAESQASALIESNTYTLTPKGSINNTFLLTSDETIWQVMQTRPYMNTPEGTFFFLQSAPNAVNSKNSLTDSSINNFEEGDLRKTNWVGSVTAANRVFYFPYKYKKREKDPKESYSEASVVFRLAEMYLIRAEARTHQGKLIGANSASGDLNIIRNRAGLPNSTANNQESLLLAIEKERWSEFFAEYGHRWLDLKRTGRGLEVLENGITQESLLWPIPADEFLKDPNLGQQNPGY